METVIKVNRSDLGHVRSSYTSRNLQQKNKQQNHVVNDMHSPIA